MKTLSVFKAQTVCALEVKVQTLTWKHPGRTPLVTWIQVGPEALCHCESFT